MLAPKDDLTNRVPVWSALCGLYVDNEMSAQEFDEIIQTCAASPYTLKELEEIMFSELWPAFGSNLLSVAGEWQGWSSETVQKAVLDADHPRWRWPWWLNPFKRVVAQDWRKVAAALVKLRAG